MEMLTSKEYAKLISETVEEKENRECYEANLIAMGKDSANRILEGYIEGQKNIISIVRKYIRSMHELFPNIDSIDISALELIIDEIEETVGEL